MTNIIDTSFNRFNRQQTTLKNYDKLVFCKNSEQYFIDLHTHDLLCVYKYCKNKNFNIIEYR